MSQIGISISLNIGLYCWKAGYLLVVTARSVLLCAIQTVEPMQSLHDYCSLSIELLWVWLRTTGWHRLAHSFLPPWLSSANSVEDTPCWAYHVRHNSPTLWSLLYLSSLRSVQDVIISYLHPFSFTFLLVGCTSSFPPSFTCFNLQKLLLPYKVSNEVR